METSSEQSFCAWCGRQHSLNDLMKLDDSLVCGECKPLYLQRMREGAIPAKRPQFLFSATGPDGKPVTEKIEAANAEAARYALNLRGYRGITFHGDDMYASSQKLFEQKGNRAQLSDADTLKLQQEPTLANMVWITLRKGWIFHLLILALIVSQIARGTPFSWGAIFAYSVIGLQMAIFIFAGRPLAMYKHLISLVEWGRWPEVQKQVERIRKANPYMLAKIPDFELDLRSAQVLAAGGRVDEGIALMAKYEGHPKVDPWMLCCRMASVYATGKQYDKCVELSRKALELAPNVAGCHIDLAQYLVLRQRNAAEARVHLEEGVQRSHAEMGEIFIAMIRGLIALEEKNYSEADQHFQTSLVWVEKFKSVPLMNGMRCLIKAYHAIAAAGVGDVGRAKQLYSEAHEWLVSVNDTMTLERCRQEIPL